MEVFYLRLVMKKSSVSCTQRFTYFQCFYYALQRWTRTHNQNLHGKTVWRVSKVHQNTELWTKLMVSQWNSSGVSSRDSPHCSLSVKSNSCLSRLSVEPEIFTRQIIFMSMFNDISWGSKDNEKECESSAQLVSFCAKRFSPGQWSFFGPGAEKKWYSISEDSPQGEWDRVAEQMMMKFAESRHQVFQSTSPIIQRSAQELRWWKIVNTLLCRWRDGWNCFSAQLFLLISSENTEQSPDLCEECKPAMSEQGDLLWQDNLTHCLCQVSWRHTYLLTDDPAQIQDL